MKSRDEENSQSSLTIRNFKDLVPQTVERFSSASPPGIRRILAGNPQDFAHAFHCKSADFPPFFLLFYTSFSWRIIRTIFPQCFRRNSRAGLQRKRAKKRRNFASAENSGVAGGMGQREGFSTARTDIGAAAIYRMKKNDLSLVNGAFNCACSLGALIAHGDRRSWPQRPRGRRDKISLPFLNGLWQRCLLRITKSGASASS